MMQLLLFLTLNFALFTSCEEKELAFEKNDIKVEIETGKNWEHDFPLLLGITKKNAPQFAVWLEDEDGNYLSTIFVTYKIATQGWISSGGNRRKEALPHWCHQRGVVYSDGLMLPTKSVPLTDGVTGATPTSDKTIQVRLSDFSRPVVIKAEFNHSVDFNGSYPKNASANADNYSGGSKGSGQPAVVYSATIDSSTKQVELKLIGHSSPDGSDGNIYPDISSLTSALSIVKSITVTII